MSAARTRRLPGDVEPIGELLARARTARGLSQLRLAELLCAAAGLPTVSRHEISRWERGIRVPGAYWLHWLAVVLRVPTDELEAAAAVACARRSSRRPGHKPRPTPGQPPRGSRPGEMAPTTPGDRAGDVTGMALTWLAAPGDLAAHVPPPGSTDRTARVPPPGCAAFAARLRDLRRLDDLVGGADLADIVDRELRAALALLRARPTRGLLDAVAQLAQLAGWTAGDAGLDQAARRAYRIGLVAAEAAGDRALGAHLLGCLSHLLAPHDPPQALLVARAAYAGAPRVVPAGVRVLLAHRIAFAAALAGRRRVSEQALATAERLADRRVRDQEPDWLYWLDDAELAGLTGRCFAALGRPLRAEPLLRRSLGRPGPGIPRTAALDGGWLAQAYLDAGEVEEACRAAQAALVAAVRCGSPRAAARALAPAARLVRCGPAAGRYAELLAAARPYLPDTPPMRWPTGRTARPAASVHP